MKSLSLLFIIFSFSSSAIADEELETSLIVFANNLKDIIATKNQLAFQKIHHKNSLFLLENKEYLKYIFGDKNNKSAFQVLKNNSLKIYTSEIITGNIKPNIPYSIIYYLPEVIKLGSKMKPETLLKNWGINYIETQVTYENGKWMFINAPFYFNSSYPWVKEYG